MATNADAHITVTANVSSATEQLKQLEAAIKSLNNAVSSFKSDSGGRSLSNALGQQISDVDSLVKDYEKTIDRLNKTLKQAGGSIGGGGTSSVVNETNRAVKAAQNQKKAIEQVAIAGTTSSRQQVNALGALNSAEESYQKTYSNRQKMYETSAATYSSSTREYEKAVARQQQYADSLASREQVTTNGFLRRVQNSAAYIAGYGVFNTLTTGLTSGLAAIRDYELGVTDLRRTLEDSEASIRNFGTAAIESAKEFGVTITDAQEAMTELARAGVDSSNLQSMTDSVLMGLNTTELETASDVTSALVSTIKQMDMDWSDSGMIIDSWNYLADKYAVQTDDFAHAIERSGAASKMLGMDLYDLNAVVTILGESTQASGEEVGTAFRSLSARLLRDSTIDKLAKYGIQVKDTNGTFLEFGQIMSNINDVIEDLPDDSIVLSDIMDTLGGAWRKNWITALTQDFDRFDKLVADQERSIGYTAEENAKAMDTIAKKAETLKQTFLEAFIDIGEDGGATEGIKNILDGTSTALETAINSPAIRTAADFLFGTPLASLATGGLFGVVTKLSGANSPLFMLGDLLSSRLSNSTGTLGGWINSQYDKVGVSGKRNRAQQLYDTIKKMNNLTDTEMIPIAEQIDGIYQSTTANYARSNSEIERYNSNIADTKKEIERLKSVEGQKGFMQDLFDNGITDPMKQAELYSRTMNDLYDNQAKNVRNLSAAQSDFNEISRASMVTTEKSVFGALQSAKFKEGIRSFVGGLAGGAAQMVAISAAAKGIDWLLNWKDNAHSDFSSAAKNYENSLAQITSQQELVRDSMDEINAAGSFVSATGENRGLSAMDYSSFTSQLQELKDIAPEVATAIDLSARRLGDYGEAATEAYRALSGYKAGEATNFLAENRKIFAENRSAWEEELRSASELFGHDWGSEMSNAKFNAVDFSPNGLIASQEDFEFFADTLGLLSKNMDDYTSFDMADPDFMRSNLDKLLTNQTAVEEYLRSRGKSDKEISKLYDDISTAENALNGIVEQNQSEGLARFVASIGEYQGDIEEKLGGIGGIEKGAEELENVQNALNTMLGSAQSAEQSDAIMNFASRLGKKADEVVKFRDAQNKMAEAFSKSSVKDIRDMISDYAEEAYDAGLVSDSEKDYLANSLFEQQFGFNEVEYQEMVDRLGDRIKSGAIDIQKAFGASSVEDISAGQFEGISKFMNDLTVGLNNEEENVRASAERIRTSLNEGLFQGLDFEKINMSDLLSLDTSQLDTVFSAFDQIQNKSSEFGQTFGTALETANQDMSYALTSLATIANTSGAEFGHAMESMFSNLKISDLQQQAEMISQVADALDMTLTDEMLEPLDLKIDNGSIVSALDEVAAAANEVDDVEVPIKGKYEEGSAQQAADQISQETEGTDAKVPIAGEAEDGSGAQAGNQIAQEAESVNPKTTVSGEAEAGSGTQAGSQIEQEAESFDPKVQVGGEAEAGAGTKAGEQIAQEAEASHPKVTIFPEIEVGESSAGLMNSLDSFLTGGGRGSQTVEIEVTADTSQAESQIQALLSSEETAKLNVQAETSEAESQIQSLLSSEETAKLTVQADTAQAESQIQSLMTSDSTAQLQVQADTGQAEAQIASLTNTETIRINVEADTSNAQSQISSLTNTETVRVDVEADTYSAESQISSLSYSGETVRIDVEADTSNAQSQISALGSYSSTINVPVDADTSRAASQIASLGASHPINVQLNVQTGNAAAAIRSVVGVAQAQVAVLSGQIATAAAQTAQISAGAAGASASLTMLLAQVQMAQAAIMQLQAVAAMPINFNINVGQLTALPGQISAVASAASAAMFQIQSSIQATAAAFAAGCAQMVSAWASMSFPAPHIPMPTISVSAGVGTYSASISWHAAGGIIPATPGGRIVGVAEGGEDEAIIPISKLRDYIKESMSDVIVDAMDDYTDAIEESWQNFAIDYGTATGSGYYSTKVEVPFLQLSDEATDTLEKFTSKKMTLDITGYDPKNIQYIIDYLTQDTNRYESLINDVEQEIEFYDNYGDSVERARAETEKLVLQWKQSRAVIQDVNKLNEEIAAYQSRASEDLGQFLDANLELNYLYAQRVDSFGEGNEEAKETFENQVKGYQELLKAMDEMQDKMRELNAEIAKSINEQAVELIENTITESYDSQIEYIEDRLDLVERERDAYEKDIEEQRDRLEKAKDEFNDDIELKDRELQDRIDAIKDQQDARDDERKLKELQEKIKDAQDRLDGLTNDYNTKVYEMGEDGQWQFTYAADPEELEEATDDLQEAQDDLKEFYEDQEIDRLEKEQDRLEREKEMYNDHYDDMMDALEEQQDMRLEAYDEEIENYQAHLDQLDELKDAALEQVDALANQLVNRLLSMFDRSYTAVFDYLQTANGNYGVQSYNPISELFPTDYAKSLMEAGYNLEEYTNQLLEITRNPTKYSPVQVYKAQGELDQLGTTGSIDVSDHIQITPKLQAAMLEHGYYSVNDFLANTLNRIGTVRIEDSGIPGREAGTVVTASDIASYLHNLGVNADVVKVSQLADKLAKNEVDEFGNVLNSILDRMEGYGTDYDFGEGGQGLLTDGSWDNLLDTIMNFDGTAQDIYDITGKLITQNSEDLALGENVVLHLINSQNFLKQLTEDNQIYYDVMMGYLEKQTGFMDANSYFAQENVAMSEGLLYAMKGSTDVNKFILEQIKRIGTVRDSGEKAGQVVTEDDILAYLNKLGISEEIIVGTITANMKLNETQELNLVKLQESIDAVLQNTVTVSELERTSGYLDTTVRRNTSSVGLLDDTIADSVVDVKKMVKDFDTSLGSYVRQLGITADDVISAANSVRAAANAAASAAAAASSSKSEKGFADGGVVSFTGPTMVHGTPSSPEVVFNAADAAKLYDLVHNDITPMGLHRINPVDLSGITNNTKKTVQPLTIENVTMNFPRVNDPDGVKQAILNLDREIRLYTK